MKNKFKKILLVFAGAFMLSAAISQNVSLNMLVLNSGVIPTGGTGTLQATVNANTGTAGQTNDIATGKINVQITVPSSLIISATQNNLAAGWIVRNNNGTVINLCNSTTTIPVNTAVELLLDLEGVTATTGSPTISGQLSFRTNCNAPGSLSGDNTSDNSSQAGYTVAGTVPVKLTNFNAVLVNCLPLLKWTTETEINSDRFEIERSNQVNSGWTTTASIPASGTSDTKKLYSYSDKDAAVSAEKILYRLKIVDRNGRYSYSEILPVFINCNKRQVNVYPNPASKGSLYVSVAGVDNNTQADLISISGQVVLKTKVTNGTNKLNIANIAGGEYILQVNFGNGVREKVKIIIQN